jgi:hypothetical protein
MLPSLLASEALSAASRAPAVVVTESTPSVSADVSTIGDVEGERGAGGGMPDGSELVMHADSASVNVRASADPADTERHVAPKDADNDDGSDHDADEVESSDAQSATRSYGVPPSATPRFERLYDDDAHASSSAPAPASRARSMISSSSSAVTSASVARVVSLEAIAEEYVDVSVDELSALDAYDDGDTDERASTIVYSGDDGGLLVRVL